MSDLANPGPLVDQARWDDLADSLGEALVEIVDTYLADTPCKLADIHSALEARDYDTAGRLAHSIKSSSGIFGAVRMVTLSKELELAADGRQPDCQSKMAILYATYQELALELQSKVTLLKS